MRADLLVGGARIVARAVVRVAAGAVGGPRGAASDGDAALSVRERAALAVARLVGLAHPTNASGNNRSMR